MYRNLARPLVLLAMTHSVALAQTQPKISGGPPIAPVETLSAYRSAFVDYMPYTEPVLMSWRTSNEQVRSSGSMQGHDMATMKSLSNDPHEGHDMSKMAKTPAAPVSAAPEAPASDRKGAAAQANHAGHQMRTADPHAGHDMSKTTPEKRAARASPKPQASVIANSADSKSGQKKRPTSDPHAGHDMSKMNAGRPDGIPDAADKAGHGAHGKQPETKPKTKKDKE